MAQVTNQAMEPVGIGPLSPEVSTVSPEGPADKGRHHNRSFTGAEIAGGILGALVFVAILFVTAAALSALVALFHWLLGPVWGNAVGTIISIILVFVMVTATLLTMGERKWSAMMQDRVGPNRARLPGLEKYSLFGLPHILADVFKMLTKEEVVPAMGNKLMFHLAPALAFAPAFVLFAVIPMSPAFPILGQEITMQVISIDAGVLYMFAIAALAVFGTTLAGWASNNKFALLGGIRASAQMVSYEVTLGLTIVGLMIIYGSLRLEEMTMAQSAHLWGWLPAWGIVYQPFAIIAYFAAASAEMKRPPFDMPEGESEIVGYYIEYSGLKFGLFMIAELVEVVVFAALFTTLFFGGYHLPWGEAWLQANLPAWLFGLVQLTTFIAKTVFFCWLSLTVRWTFPRFRYDQIMNLGWKILLPLSLANILLTGMVVLWKGREGAALFGLVQAAIVIFAVIGTIRTKRTGDESSIAEEDNTAMTPATAHH